MNKQGHKQNPRGGIEWTHIFGPGTGYTANPVRGCAHGCRWLMPDDKLAVCYAEEIAKRFPGKHFADGFDKISFDEKELLAIAKLKTPAAIFIDSMSDLFGQGVKAEWIDKVVATIRTHSQHVFFSLTKNPSRFLQFSGGAWPEHWLVGISMPPTFMFGKQLLPEQQRVWLMRAQEFLRNSPAQRRWISLEPLSFDVADILDATRCKLDWAVIGAASCGAKTFQPDKQIFRRALEILDRKKIPVFFKGNLSREFVKDCGWREEFPNGYEK